MAAKTRHKKSKFDMWVDN